MKRKFLALLLAFVMVVGMLPMATGDGSKFTLQSGTLTNNAGSGIFCSYGGHAFIKGGKVHAKSMALTGNNLEKAMYFEISGGVLEAEQGAAIYQSGPVSMKITDGEIKGGINVRMGDISIEGGKITNNSAADHSDTIGEYYAYSGNVWFPNAITLFGGTYTSSVTGVDNHMTVNITGGEIESTIGDGIAVYALSKVAQTISVNISGDTTKVTGKMTDGNAVKVYSANDIKTLATTTSKTWNTAYEVVTNNPVVAITGGTFSSDPFGTDTGITSTTHEAKTNSEGKYVVAAKSAGLGDLTFSAVPAGADGLDQTFAEKQLKELGNFQVEKDTETGKIMVTGSANYLEWTKFNEAAGHEDEQKGHYILFRAEVPEANCTSAKVEFPGDGSTKVQGGFTTSDRNVDVPMHVNADSTDKTFQVSYYLDGDTANKKTYTVDWSGVTLLPKPVQNEDGSTTESKVDPEDENTVVTETTTRDGEVIGSVGLPADTEGLGGMTVEVKTVESSALPQAIQDSNSKVAAALKEASTKLVEVTVKMVDENGDEQEQFTSDAALAKADIIITIGGLEGGKTYYVFSIDNEGNVTSYGYKELGADESSIQVSSKHLTILAAAEVDTAEDGTGLKASDVQGDTNVDKTDETTSGLTQSDGTPPTPATGNTTWDSTEKVGVGEGTVTITGLTINGAYVAGIEYNGAKVYANVTATGTTLKIGCQKGAKVSLTDNSSNPVNLNGASEYTVPTT